MLKDLKIVELASVLAGPAVGMFFAEMGCTVTKVESRKAGDITRRWKLPTESSEAPISAYYSSVNWNKEVLRLDYLNAEDFETLRSYLQEADVVITNFKHGDGEKFGLTYAHLIEINPKLIVGEINGFGPDSPRAAFDVVLQAETGFISMSGHPDGDPVKMPVALIDVLAAHQLKEGLLVALLNQKRPQRVTVSLYEAALASLVNQATNFLMEEHVPQPMGTLHPNIAPYGDLFYSSDNLPLVLAVGNNKQFESLLKVLSIEPLPSLASNELRVKNRAELQAVLQEKIGTWKREDFFKSCLKHSIPMGRVLNLKEVFEQPEAQSLVLEENREGVKTRRVKTTVFNSEF
ncbi:CoA transferase [bacterium SCSIO 12741]|nr:CoA transferase [bacterium SCSIO 12741]